MKLRHTQVLALVVAALAIIAATASYAKDKSNDSGRLLTGKVTGKQDQALVNAVVYLSNTRTRVFPHSRRISITKSTRSMKATKATRKPSANLIRGPVSI